MILRQIVLTIAAVAMVFLLFSLPKVVIDTGSKPPLAQQSEVVTPGTTPFGSNRNSSLNTGKAKIWRKKLAEAFDSKKTLIFADSLVSLYIGLGKFDSAEAITKRIVLEKNNSVSVEKFAGNMYLNMAKSVDDSQLSSTYYALAAGFYGNVLTKDPKDLEVKNNLALTFIATETPMKGVAMLKEILAADPDNETALFNLGFLSIQSGQYDKAADRFIRLIQIDQSNLKAHYYLAEVLLQLGKSEEAKKELNSILSSTGQSEWKQKALKLQAEMP